MHFHEWFLVQDELRKARKQTDEAEWAQTDALDKLKRYEKLHSESQSLLAANMAFFIPA